MDAVTSRPPLASALRRHVPIRSLRLATGLCLFVYVTTHLLNHALGNVSFDVLEAGLDWNTALWRSGVATLILYGALLIHAGLGLRSLLTRPKSHWSIQDVVQTASGLLIPPLLIGHVVSTRLSYALYGTQQSYAQVLYRQWVDSPELGVQQAVVLVIAWVHGCIGLYAWLRLKRGFPQAAPYLLCLAVLIPVLALLGFAAGGRAVVAFAADPSWRVENVPPTAAESLAVAAQLDRLLAVQRGLLASFGAAVILTVAGRFLRLAAMRRRGSVVLSYPNGATVKVPSGTSVLQASQMRGIPHANVCGGRGRCSTCRIRIIDPVGRHVPQATPDEQAVLDRIGAAAGIRLACQLVPLGDLQVVPLVATVSALAVARQGMGAHGEERFVVAMFVDMRGSTRLAEQHLPFDTVFIVNRFLDAVTRAVIRAGGVPNQFLGDGLMALFGLATDGPTAARQALAAVEGIGSEIAALNALMATSLSAPLGFGIGVHAGPAILGEIGSREGGHVVFTAIGDTVNVAARLQSMTKGLEAEAIVSTEVFAAAGSRPATVARDIAIVGRVDSIAAHALVRATDAGVGVGAAGVN